MLFGVMIFDFVTSEISEPEWHHWMGGQMLWDEECCVV